MNYEGEFDGKCAVITGAAGIYGRWMAEAFAAEGMRLLLSDADAAGLDAFAATLPNRPETIVTDLTRDADLEALLSRAEALFGAPDILVNNAGVFPSGWLLDIDLAEWDRIMGVNLRAVFALTRGTARQMIAAGKGGSVINVSSGASRKMRTTVVPYCTSKTALDRLTKGFALELARFGIRVNALEPGFAPGSAASPLTDAHVEATTAGIPLGRQSGPADAPGAALWLASQAASYVTGATLAVDGGNSIGTSAVFQDKKEPL
ncbi:SDR family NAD(P)-dependent oxidoreductase [Roseivivax isoporae]|uniref:Oxidoreductase n=1 Tax=Roseivivax isoporae LMG 25204 TaxID=1449351 RepID=X7FAS9_9RHOB|nr:SDR family oxidoreductase [Roseivivax isoporae]ETX29895.1 oxidoreductase [Roseivivax isoporae LMG 25204]